MFTIRPAVVCLLAVSVLSVLGCQTVSQDPLIIKYEKLVQENPNSAEKTLALGALYVRAERYGHARDTLKAGRRLWDRKSHSGSADKLIDKSSESLIEVLDAGLAKGIYSYDTSGNSMAARIARMVAENTKAKSNALLSAISKKTGEQFPPPEQQ